MRQLSEQKISRFNLHAFALLVLLSTLLVFMLCSCSAGVYHTVQPGQTLYRIGKTYNVDEHYLARINGISDPTTVKVGTRLYIPGAEKVKPVAVYKAQPAPVAPKTSSASKATPSVPKKSTPAKTPTEQKTTTAKISVPRQLPVKQPAQQPVKTVTARKILLWPLRGKILSSFSSQAQAGRGRGIEIGVRLGSDVSAAAAGKVIYSGDGVNGYGHLIILQHKDDLFTIYGFNKQNLVAMGDFVGQGQKIALSGVPSSGGSPRLHFEVRQGKTPVDPILFLP